MVTTFENQIKITFELNPKELRELYSVLNTACISVNERINGCPTQGDDYEFLLGSFKSLENFTEKFNPCKLSNV